MDHYYIDHINNKEKQMNIKKSVRIGLAYKGETQAWLAAQIGMNPDALSHALTRNTLNSKLIEKAALALGLKSSEFIALGEEK
jgi:lambda repressor-like predicted transcriptional regulator